MKQQQPDWAQRIESDLESIDWILWRNQDTKFFPKSYNEVRLVLQKLVRDMQATQEEKIMQLTNEQLEELDRLYSDAKKLGKQGKKQEASAVGAKALSIANQAAIEKMEAGIENKAELVYADISVLMPVKPGTNGYHLTIDLIEGSPFAQEILAVLKKYHQIGYAGAREEDNFNDVQEIVF